MKLRRFLAAATAAAVVTSVMAVTSFAASEEVFSGTATVKSTGGWWDAVEPSISDLIGDADPATIDSIAITAENAAKFLYNYSADAEAKTIDIAAGETIEITDMLLDPDLYWCAFAVSTDDATYVANFEWTVTAEVADAPVVDAPADDTTDVPTDDVVVEAPAALALEECYNGGTIVLIDDKGGNAYATANGLDILDVYGYRVTAQFPMAEVSDEAFWIGGGIGANSNSTGWASTEWGKASGAKPIVAEFDEQGVTTLELLSDASIFAADDAFAQLWIQSWGGTMNIISVELLAADGTAIAEAVVGEIAPVEDAPVADDTVVDTEAPSTDAGKDSPDTGVEGIAAVAGVVALAGVAVVASRKRK